MPRAHRLSSLLIAGLCALQFANAQNPIINTQFTADPTARVFEGKMYLYPSHDIQNPVNPKDDWFCMEDYHVYSSEDLVNWHDHGVIVTQNKVPWVKPDSYAMWAPDCVKKGETYYFYFPAAPKGMERGFTVGVATASSPAGPFTPMEEPIKGIMGIDPCVLNDYNGQSYIFWSGMGIRGAKLGDDMASLASEPVAIEGLPEGFKEGPFAFTRNGKYYLTFPWVREKTETLAYAMSDKPLGPYEFKGLIMEESPTGCWTNHHSIVEYNGQWYLFYHHNDYSPKFDKHRSTRIDALEFNPDGTIQLVKPTLRGVGIVPSDMPIQLDRYSEKSPKTSVEYIDNKDYFKGWKTILSKPGDWIKFDKVDFGAESPILLAVRYKSKDTSKIEVKAGESAVEINLPKAKEWTTYEMGLENVIFTGVKNLEAELKSGAPVEIDYIQFFHLPPYAESAGVDNGIYFNKPKGKYSEPDDDGFIRRWHLLEPINKPNRSNTVFTDSYLRNEFCKDYFDGQKTEMPSDGQCVAVGDSIQLKWHLLESTGFNNQLFRFASTNGKQVYGVLFFAATVIDCPEDVENVRLAVGSNSASMWWIDGEEALLLSGDRRMVADDAMSQRLTLKKGKHILRGAVINGPGMSNFCVRFLNEDGTPVKNIKICDK